MTGRRMTMALALGATLSLGMACSGDDGERWQLVLEDLPGALMSVWGSSPDDVWAVGGDPGDGGGPTVLRYDGDAWNRLATGETGDLWWVHGFPGGPVFLGGAGGMILRYDSGGFTRMATPGTNTVFGIWGPSATDLWAVGGGAGGSGGGFVWRSDGQSAWAPQELPEGIAEENALWKVHGAGGDVWIVGTSGVILQGGGETIEEVESPTARSLFTVSTNGQVATAVGGFGSGVLVENDGSGWSDVTPPDAQQLIGVFLADDTGYAVGLTGAVYERTPTGWEEELTGLPVFDPFHAVWVDPEGGAWAVGGQVLAAPFVDGVLIYRGKSTISGSIDQ